MISKRRDCRGGGVDVYNRATWRRISSRIDPTRKSGNKMKSNKTKKK